MRRFGFGAVDYLTKPFHPGGIDRTDSRDLSPLERAFAIHHQDRRYRGEFGRKTVEVRGNTMHLTGKEYQMLELLSLHKGTSLTKEMFLNHLYGGMDQPELKIIDVFICNLRKKLSEATGRGYVLRDPKPDDAAQDMAISA